MKIRNAICQIALHLRRRRTLLKQTDTILAALAPVVDGVAILVGFLFLNEIAAWFQARHVLNVVGITLVYAAFCVAVYLIRKLEPQLLPEMAAVHVPEWLLKRPTMTTFAVLFGLTLAVLMLDQLGYWESIFLVDDRALGAGESAAFFVFAPGAFIAIALFYILVLSGPTRETILVDSGRYLPLALLGLLGVNGMMLLLTAVLQAMPLPWWLILPALLLLFAPPRIWYVVKRPSYIPILSFLLLILFYGWQIIA
jgi:hypothetical protein